MEIQKAPAGHNWLCKGQINPDRPQLLQSNILKDQEKDSRRAYSGSIIGGRHQQVKQNIIKHRTKKETCLQKSELKWILMLIEVQ